MGTYTAFIVYSICNDLAPSFHCTNYQTQAKNIGNSISIYDVYVHAVDCKVVVLNIIDH